MTIETRLIPVISTAHVTLEVNNALVAGDNDWVACATLPEWGYFLYLDDLEAFDDLNSPPQCLNDIRDWLYNSNFTDGWVRLDCDGPIMPDLPTYDW